MNELTLHDKEFLDRLNEHYDSAIKDILRRLREIRPLTKEKMLDLLLDANKQYWTERINMIDAYTTLTAEYTAAALALPYADAAEELANRARSVYSGFRSAFHLSQREAKELLASVRYDRSIADNLKAMAESMTPGAERDRVFAELSAPAYRFRMERAGEMYRQAAEICDRIARNETDIVRRFLQTDIEREANITLSELGLPQPADAVVDMLSEPVRSSPPESVPAVRQSSEVTTPAPIRDFTPTNDAAIAPSFSLISPERVERITAHDWDGKNFSERIWANTDALAKEVKDTLLWGELTGASEAEMAARIRERFDTAMYKARRVVRTEHTYNCAQTELASLKNAGFTEYQFRSLHEERDCEHCDDLDGQVFRIDEAAPGINLPPIHPFCRCRITCVPVTVEEIEQEIDDMLRDMGMQEGEDPDEFISRKVEEQISADEQAKAQEQEQAKPTADAEPRRIASAGRENSAEGVDKSENGGIIIGRGSGLYEYPVVSPEECTKEKLGSIDANDSKQIAKTLSEFENKYRDSDIEHCIVISNKGDVYIVHGGPINVHPEILGDDVLRGSINEHNHIPEATQRSFGKDDFINSATDGTNTALACDDKYRYYMRFPRDYTEAEASRAYKNATDSVNYDCKLYPDRVPEGDEQHERIKRACEELGIEYGRNEISR